METRDWSGTLDPYRSPRSPRCGITGSLSQPPLKGMGEVLGEASCCPPPFIEGGDLGLLAFWTALGLGGLLPGRAGSESAGMPGTAILLETQTHKNRASAFFVRGPVVCRRRREAGESSPSLWTGPRPNWMDFEKACVCRETAY